MTDTPDLPRVFLYIIESPHPEDLLDGRAEGRMIQHSMRLAGEECHYALTVNLSTFKSALGRLESLLDSSRAYPLLHLSVHGDKDGIEFTSGESLSWDELAILFEPVNRVLSAPLFLSMSSCEGFFALTMAVNDSKDPPFGMVLGSPRKIEWSVSAVAFTTFYHRFFQTTPRDIQKCVEAMRVASNEPSFFTAGGWEVRGWTESARAPTEEDT